MTQAQWIILIAGLIGGGAMGAVINNIWSNYRNRIQPIGSRKEIIPFVNQKIGGTAMQAEILLTMDGKRQSFEKLILGRVTLQNTSNKDYEEFNFGITLSALNLAVSVQPETPDRYHEMSSSPKIDLEYLDNQIDFSLKPFNRNDVYSVVLFILPTPTDKPDEDSVVDISLITKHPVRFVELSAYRSFAKAILVEVIEGVPYVGLPIRSFRRRLKP